LLMNKATWDGFDEGQQAVSEEAIEGTTKYHRELIAAKEDETIEMLEENGVTITEPDREALSEATREVKASIDDVPEDLVERIANERSLKLRGGKLPPSFKNCQK